MFNLLKTDIRRLLKSRSFYILLAVAAILILMVSAMAAYITDPETLDEMSAQGADVDEHDQRIAEEIRKMDQLDLAHETLGGGFLLVVTGIGMTLFANGDFSSGFVKNICCVQPRRVDYVLAKALTAGVYSGIITVLGAALILSSPYFYGLRPQPCAVPDILGYVVLLWLPHWAFALMALALVLLTRSTTLGIILSLVAGSGLTALLLGTLGRLLHLPPFERWFLAVMVKGIYTPETGIASIGLILACTAVWAVIYGVGGLLSMEKQDI